MAGAPKGNSNATRGKVWRDAIERALARRDQARTDGTKEIDDLAERLLTLAFQGDLGALKEFGDRMEGKPAQAIVGDAGADPVQHAHRLVEYVG